MNTPKKLLAKSREQRIRYAVDRLVDRTGFKPGKRYKLNVRKSHPVPEDKKYWENDDGLLKRNEHWENVSPPRYVNLPRKRNAPGNKTSINDLTSIEKFKNWFEETFPNLDNGVYGIIQRKGRSGYYTMFVVKYRDGKVKKFQEKSKSQERRKKGSSSRYFGFGYYFYYLRERAGITS